MESRLPRIISITYDDLCDDAKIRFDIECPNDLLDSVETANDLNIQWQCGDIIDGYHHRHDGFVFINSDGSLITSNSEYVNNHAGYMGVGIPIEVTKTLGPNALDHFSNEYIAQGCIVSIQLPYDDIELHKYELPKNPEKYTYELCYEANYSKWCMYAFGNNNDKYELIDKPGEEIRRL